MSIKERFNELTDSSRRRNIDMKDMRKRNLPMKMKASDEKGS